jgi:hypothetical protein
MSGKSNRAEQILCSIVLILFAFGCAEGLKLNYPERNFLGEMPKTLQIRNIYLIEEKFDNEFKLEMKEFIYKQEICKSIGVPKDILDVSMTFDNPALLLAISKVESRFNPNAVGKIGELGITQINPIVWKEIVPKKEELFCVPVAFEKTEEILSILSVEKNTKNVKTLLAHYNGGNRPNYRYAEKVLREKKRIEEKF